MNPGRPRHRRHASATLQRRCHQPFLLGGAPAPAPLNRRDHLDLSIRHVTIPMNSQTHTLTRAARRPSPDAYLLRLSPIQTATARTFLECKGYSIRLNTQVEHEIAIYKTMAEFDGKTYRLSETTTEFTLTGPLSANDTIIYINRLTGEYAITPASLGGDSKKSGMVAGW